MAFDNFGITTNGYTMIAKATTGLLMTFQDGRASSNTITQENIASAVSSDFSTLTNGVLKALSVTGSAVQAIVEFGNAGLQSAVTLKSFCIRAHTSESSTTNYVFAVCSLNDGGITVQPRSVTGVEVRFQVPFDLTFDGAASYIEGIPVGNNASVDMLDRFVSTHSLADPAAGDAQTILGEKTFNAHAFFEADVDISGTTACRDVIPYENSNKLGENGRRFGGVWALALHGAVPTASLDNNVVVAEVGSIMCIKRASPSTDYFPVGYLLYNTTTSAWNVSSLDGAVYGNIPLGYYRVISPKPAAASSSDTDGNKPFLVVYLGLGLD